MIRNHQFNTEWYGAPAGIVDSRAFFDLPVEERRRLLAPFAWVEFKASLADAPDHRALLEADFFWADTQIPFRIALHRVPELGYGTGLLIVTAADEPFTVAAEAMAPFSHERFGLLPGVTPAGLARRYSRWAELLVSNAPATCLELRKDGQTQGWFLGEPRKDGAIGLTLAMLHREATISGMSLYGASLAHFARLGYRVGGASFSARNTPVHNLYSRLGARFVEPSGIWMRICGGQALSQRRGSD